MESLFHFVDRMENSLHFNVIYKEAWVSFIDDQPLANWAHPCRYIFIKPNGKSISMMEKEWPPDERTFSLLEKIVGDTIQLNE